MIMIGFTLIDMESELDIFYKKRNNKFMLNNLGLGLTDKASPSHINHGRSYLDIYEDYFDPIKDKNLNVLEIGINNGGSLKLWKKYFKNSKIFGLDIDPRCKAYAEENVNVHIGSQGDEETISKLVGDAKTFDIIIDDGSHVNELTIKSFHLLFNKLNSNGYYIIEDMGCSYSENLQDDIINGGWPGMRYNFGVKMTNIRSHMDDFLNSLIHHVDREVNACKIRYVHFYRDLVVIKKL